MAAPYTFTVLEHCHVSPPQGSVPSTCLPLTFFDIPWLLFSPSQPLFFYVFPHSTTHFTQTILPNLKHSLSLTLQHFFPFAGKLITPPKPSKPEILYTDGDSVSLTIVESNANFNNLCSYHPRDVKEFYPLVPQLESRSVNNDTQILPLLAMQVTIFPNCGVCFGFSYRHVVADGRTFDHFLKFWMSTFRDVLNFSLSNYKLIQFYDRSIINDPNGLEEILMKQRWELKSFQKEVMGNTRSGPGDMVRATFVVSQTDMAKLEQCILSKCQTKNYLEPLLLSPYVVTCALTWICLLKARGFDIEDVHDESHYFGFIAGGITRLNFPVPTNYFGNCVAFGRSMANRNELLGEDGLVIAAKAIGDKIKELNGDVLGVAKKWILDWKVLFGSELHVMVSGSPKLDLYGLDFGWGRPKKIEEISIDNTCAISLVGSRDLEGGIDVGLSLTKGKMDTFSSLFLEGLKVPS